MSKAQPLTIAEKLELEKQGRIFEYQLCDTFALPITDVCVRRVEGRPQARFASEDAFFRVLRDQTTVINLTEYTFAQISIILKKNNKIFTLERRLRDDFSGLDGCENVFYFNDSDRSAEFSGHCLWTVLNQRFRFPAENLVIDTLYSIRDILVPLGVSEDCFQLSR